MEVRLLYFADCPHWRLAEARLRAALAGLEDTGSAVTHELVETPEQAERTGFRGSPTILVDGLDPLLPRTIRSACRVGSIAARTESSTPPLSRSS